MSITKGTQNYGILQGGIKDKHTHIKSRTLEMNNFDKVCEKMHYNNANKNNNNKV